MALSLSPSQAQFRISHAARASAPALMRFAKICSRASRSACLRDPYPPDLFWISVASRAMVKASSTYFSHLHLLSVNSTQYCVGGGSTIGVRSRFISLAFERGAMLPNRWTRLRLLLRAREREREKIEDEDLNTLPCRVRVVFNLF